MSVTSPSPSSAIEAERLRLFISSITDYAIYTLSPEGIVTSWNAGAQRFKGYREDEILAVALLALLLGRGLRRRPPRTCAGGSARHRPLRGRRLARAQGRHALLGQRGAGPDPRP
ncbi:hypothetical protein [Massilia sp. Root351]|uniref:hypothetical protein n=1 Tax=Massilia sp. Root351 TaxID=1736522 RepID=UPI0027D7E5BD|nr:hypothetical protein [Massilia sp. Root351]